MATPVCPKCGNTTFENNIIQPKNSNYKLTAINCDSCGAIIGVLDYFNIGGMLQTLARKLNVGSIAG
jgi:hypothetical protein